MPRYRHLPTEVDAELVPDDLVAGNLGPFELGTMKAGDGPVSVVCNSHHGQVLARPGTYVIRAADGETYPMEADHFRDAYEQIPDPVTAQEPVTDAAEAPTGQPPAGPTGGDATPPLGGGGPEGGTPPAAPAAS